MGQNTTPPLHDGDPYVNAFTFESYEELYAFLSSKERRQLMINLSPLLEATSVAQISGIFFTEWDYKIMDFLDSKKN